MPGGMGGMEEMMAGLKDKFPDGGGGGGGDDDADSDDDNLPDLESM